MATYIQPMAEKFNMQRAKKLRWQKAVTAMAAVVVFCTTYALIIPALTWERTLICEKTEHTHTEACYETVEIPAATKLSCGKEEHQHSDACLGEVRTLVCSQTECEAHQHDESCYTEETYLTCTDEDPEHIHDESCYAARTVLTCGKEETEGHTHGESCYVTEIGYICGLEEHAHDESCSTEVPAHTEEILVCGLEEHAHTDDCFDAPPAPEDEGYYCGHIAHVHDESCYFEEGGALKCTLEEHEHTKLCESNPNADRERERDWIASFDDAVLRSNWAKNTIAIAETQIGYKESTKNFIVTEDGKPMGYTRYGAWYGGEYGDWCAMFCSFCLHYAGVDAELMPVEESCHRWVEILQDEEYDLYRPAEEYTPVPGDLVFFDWDEFDPEDEKAVAARSADHVGFVYEVIEATENMPAILRTIEGNSGNVVRVNEYELTDMRILGYAELPENPDDDVRTLCFEGEDYHIAVSYTAEAAIPEEAELTVREILPGSAEFDSYYDQMIDPQQTNSVKFIRLFDICFVVDGEEFEPSAPVDVNITYDEELPYVEEEDECQTIHFADSGMESLDTEITVSEDGQSTLAFTQESFSVTATVVTKPQTGTYYQRVDTIDSTSANYLIVSAEGNYALQSGNSTYSTQITLQPVKGYPKYYAVSNVTDNMRWRFGATGGSGTASTVRNNVGSSTTYLRLDNTSFLGNSRSQTTRTYNATTGTWTLSNGNYYLWNDSGKFSRSNSTSTTYQRNMLILKQVSTTLNIPDDVTSGSGSDTGDGDEKVRPTYEAYIEPSAAKSGSGAYSGASSVTMSYASDPATSDIERAFTGTSTNISLFGISGTNGMTNEGYGNLFDGKTQTKYCVNPESGKVAVTFKANAPQFVSGYSLTTANDNATTGGRIPDGWTIYGSQSRNGDWVVLDRVTDTDMEAKNFTEYTYSMSNPGTYEYFKIEFDTDHMIQFSELKFSETPASNDGKVLTDKSVVYGKDDYNAFNSYDEGTFGVTLSALGQDYQLKEVDQVKIPADVVFVLDVSGSMTKYDAANGGEASNDANSRRTAMVSAVNSAMRTIFENNPENRVGIAIYSSGSATLLPLDHYTSRAGNFIESNSSKNVQTVSGISNSKGETVTQTTGMTQQKGTYTQQGIARGAAILENNKETTYTATLNTGTAYEKTVTVNRQPVIILLSDGDPTHCTSNYTDPLSGPNYGSGSYTSTTNNQGIEGYYTILSANYFKRMVSIHYDTPALFYSVGMGINATGIVDLSGGSATGDHYKRAVLNPTPGNITDLHEQTGASNYGSTANQLYQLLTNSYTGNSVRISSTSSYAALGTTNSVVPVLQNPYSSYSYADGAYFGNIGTAELQKIFGSIIKSSLNVKSYGYMLYQGSSVDVSDTIGSGMGIKGTPVLRYNGRNYDLTKSSEENGVVTYVCNSTSSTRDGSAPNGGQRTADLSQIGITVTTKNGIQTVEMHIPEAVVPSYTPDISADWYYEQLPVRLIYQVGLTDDAKTAVQNLSPGQSLTYYTNAWGNISASSTQRPHQDNPYYNNVTYDNGTSRTKQYHDYSVDKTENTTGTAATSAASVETVNSRGRTTQVDVALGNNGKLIFCSNAPELVSITIKKVDMNGNIIASSAEFEVYGDAALTDKIGTYTTANGEVAIEDLTIGTTYYLVETKAPDGYNILPGPRAFLVNADGEIGEPSESGGYKAFQGDAYLYTDGSTFVLYVRNSNGYELPETGGIGTNTIYTLGASLTAGALMYGCILRRKRERRAY